ncbi:MAG: histidine phosphatase family protein, partial [Candidatus Omnitrophica bacterium]|nr:histidine phosphatase family protein [Candidatus Omnitrophota bacterium]
MNLYLIRHGESTWNRENRIQGNSDPGLSALGRSQAVILAKGFKKMQIDRLYSSPLARSIQTARPIAQALGLKIIRREHLKEIGLGEWENKTPDEINGLYDSKFKRWLRFGPSKIDIPGSEPVAHFRKRVDRQFAEIIKENIEKDNIV